MGIRRALRPLILDAMAEGYSADAALARVTEGRPHIHYRQLMAIDRRGATATFMGEKVFGRWGVMTGTDCAAAGNMLDSERVPHGMVEAFESAQGNLGDRLMLAGGRPEDGWRGRTDTFGGSQVGGSTRLAQSRSAGRLVRPTG